MLDALVSGLFGVANTAVETATDRDIANANLDYQRETNVKNEALMRESWMRDDNAVQRRAEDMRAAGMSPLLAAGDAASNSGPTNMQAPHDQRHAIDFSGALNSLMQGMAIQKTVADMDAQKQQIELSRGELGIRQLEAANRMSLGTESNRIAAVNAGTGISRDKREGERFKLDKERHTSDMLGRSLDRDYTNILKASAEHNLAISRDKGIRTGDDSFGIQKLLLEGFKSIGNMIGNAVKK